MLSAHAYAHTAHCMLQKKETALSLLWYMYIAPICAECKQDCSWNTLEILLDAVHQLQTAYI